MGKGESQVIIQKNDVVEFNGKRYVAVMRDRRGWWYSPCRKDGIRPDQRRDMQILTSEVKKVGSYTPGEKVAKSPDGAIFGLAASSNAIAASQMNHMIESFETYTKHRIECFVCLKAETDRDITEAKFARWLYQEGWRYKASDSCQTIGIMCPKCAAKPDSKLND